MGPQWAIPTPQRCYKMKNIRCTWISSKLCAKEFFSCPAAVQWAEHNVQVKYSYGRAKHLSSRDILALSSKGNGGRTRQQSCKVTLVKQMGNSATKLGHPKLSLFIFSLPGGFMLLKQYFGILKWCIDLWLTEGWTRILWDIQRLGYLWIFRRPLFSLTGYSTIKGRESMRIFFISRQLYLLFIYMLENWSHNLCWWALETTHHWYQFWCLKQT